MLQGVDLNQVKQFNASLKQYKDKAASLNAEIEYTNKEIDALCAELTAELGIQVTRDNIQQVYDEQVSKINSTLQSGNAVLAKIANEEQAAQSQTVAQTQAPIAQTSAPLTQVQTPIQPTAPTAPTAPVQQVQTSEMNNQAAIPAASSGTEFGTAQPNVGGLPTLFSMNQ